MVIEKTATELIVDGEMAFFLRWNGFFQWKFLFFLFETLLITASGGCFERPLAKAVWKNCFKGCFQRPFSPVAPERKSISKSKNSLDFHWIVSKNTKTIFCMCSNSINLLRWLIFNRFIGSSYSAQICFCRQAECFFLSVCFCRILWYQLKVFFVLLSHFKPALNYVVCKMFLLWFFLRSVRSSSVSVLIFCLFIYVFASAGDSNTL